MATLAVRCSHHRIGQVKSRRRRYPSSAACSGFTLGIGAACIMASLAAWPVVIAPEMVVLAMVAAAATDLHLPARPAANRSRERPISEGESLWT